MPKSYFVYRILLIVFGLIAATALASAQSNAPVTADAATQKLKMPAIPSGKENDIKFYDGKGGIVIGDAALAKMSNANLILWVAGNQFFAMNDVVSAFQKSRPETSVGLITLPPGLLLQAIKAGGWVYGDKEYSVRPDIYASVNLGHLKQLKAAGMMDSYMVYMHNELQIMVAKGNPKKITGVKDLVRADIRTSMPNPINEGIMQFYMRKVLERHGIWQQISAGKECVSCQTTPNNWFTAVHHRETPDRLKAGQSDAGVVWKTEALEALRQGAQVEAIELPAEDSLRDEVSYAIGTLKNTEHQKTAQSYMEFLRTNEGQEIYAKYGFVKASNDDLKLRPID